MSIPYIRAIFSAPIKVIMPKPAQKLQDWESDLAGIIQLYLKEFSMDAIISPEDNPTSTIRPGVPGKMASRWTIEPYFVVAPTE